MKSTEERILGFIARANDPASTFSEREMAERKAKELILESGIIPGKEEKLEFFIYQVSGRFENWKFLLFCQLCKFMGAYGVKRGHCLGFWGYASQKDSVFTMADHFFNAVSELGIQQRGKGRSWVNSYKMGLASGICASFERKLPDGLQEKAMVFVGTYEAIKAQKQAKNVEVSATNAQALQEGFRKGMTIEDAKNLEEGETKLNKFLLGA